MSYIRRVEDKPTGFEAWFYRFEDAALPSSDSLRLSPEKRLAFISQSRYFSQAEVGTRELAGLRSWEKRHFWLNYRQSEQLAEAIPAQVREELLTLTALPFDDILVLQGPGDDYRALGVILDQYGNVFSYTRVAKWGTQITTDTALSLMPLKPEDVAEAGRANEPTQALTSERVQRARQRESHPRHTSQPRPPEFKQEPHQRQWDRIINIALVVVVIVIVLGGGFLIWRYSRPAPLPAPVPSPSRVIHPTPTVTRHR